MEKVRGSSLLELSMTICIIALTTGMVIPQVSLAYHEKLEAWHTLQWLYLTRMQAIAMDQDIRITCTENTLSSSQSQLPMHSTLQLGLNVSQLGFKASGRTLSAGTLTLKGLKTYTITLGIGNGKPRLR